MISDKALDMHEETIACNLIDMPPLDTTVRSFNKEFAKQLSVSLREQGLFNPIAVRPNPAKPGRYLLVQGRHRWWAWFKILKEQMIRATILPDMDDEEAGIAAVAENFWRLNASKIQKIKQTKKWHDYYAKKHGLGVEAKSSDGAEPVRLLDETATSMPAEGCAPVSPGMAEQIADSPASESPPAVDAGVETPTPKNKRGRPKGKTDTGNFIDHVVASTGVSKPTVKRDLRLGKVFSDEELEMFERLGTTYEHLEAIAGIEDHKNRNALMALIASGMKFDVAWKHTVGTEGIMGSAISKNSNDTKTNQSDAEMTDEEWIATYCSEKLAVLGHPEKFKADAILYREIRDARAKFRAAVKTAVKRRRDTGTTGYLWYLVNRLINISGPMDWYNCPDCGGAGEVDGNECLKCRKAGYVIRTEKYE